MKIPYESCRHCDIIIIIVIATVPTPHHHHYLYTLHISMWFRFEGPTFIASLTLIWSQARLWTFIAYCVPEHNIYNQQ